VAQRPEERAFDPTTDDGSADERIRTADTPAELLAALRAGRLLVAIVATADEVDDSGADKSSHMSVVSMIAADGRRGLLAFTGLDSLHEWDPSARPVPVTGPDAAEAALQDGCEALVIDVAGPQRRVVIEADLLDLAGMDRLEYVRDLAQRALDEQFGAGVIGVGTENGRLQVASERIGQSEITQALQRLPRVLALVPAGIEVLADQ
jgi:hypothetical protein